MEQKRERTGRRLAIPGTQKTSEGSIKCSISSRVLTARLPTAEVLRASVTSTEAVLLSPRPTRWTAGISMLCQAANAQRSLVSCLPMLFEGRRIDGTEGAIHVTVGAQSG